MKFMRLVLPVAFLMAGLALTPAVGGQEDDSPYPYDDTGAYIPFTMAGLEELAAPVALYPDPLLAQILPAVTSEIRSMRRTGLSAGMGSLRTSTPRSGT